MHHHTTCILLFFKNISVMKEFIDWCEPVHKCFNIGMSSKTRQLIICCFIRLGWLLRLAKFEGSVGCWFSETTHCWEGMVNGGKVIIIKVYYWAVVEWRWSQSYMIGVVESFWVASDTWVDSEGVTMVLWRLRVVFEVWMVVATGTMRKLTLGATMDVASSWGSLTNVFSRWVMSVLILFLSHVVWECIEYHWVGRWHIVMTDENFAKSTNRCLKRDSISFITVQTSLVLWTSSPTRRRN